MNKKGFTLAEMMIVVIMISGLMLLIIPKLGETKTSLDHKSCDAFVNLVDSQIQAFYLDKSIYPMNVTVLFDAGYIKSKTCPDGTEVSIENKKAVKVAPTVTSDETTN
ncbi:MAG: competence protein ComG [Haloplasmataceae bacterium]|nr:competence protein ComG [Haloplasmataceae bacterium]